MLKGKRILLGVTGSIAAYKSAHLTRLLVKEQAEVKVIMTPSAVDFITPLTLATLSKNPVESDLIASREEGIWNNHVEYGLWADLMIIAPASANTMAKMAEGICDNLLMATYLSGRCPVFIAPAMDVDMWKHAATRKNIEQLQNNGVSLIPPGTGELASGLSGEGRMAEPEEIVEWLTNFLVQRAPLRGKKVLITAGPTHEAIDPVRFIGNHSSGKMGIALAEKAKELGAEVVLVCGPSSVKSSSSIHRIDVVSAEQMYIACQENFESCDIAILAAAVADYRPAVSETSKIKKKDEHLTIDLIPTRDILKSLGEKKSAEQYLVGFALETDNEVENARKKIQSKNLDLIVLNSLKDAGAGFAHDTNKISIMDAQNNLISFELKSKGEVANDIWNTILERLK